MPKSFKDVRTYVFSRLGGAYAGLSCEAFVERIRADENWMHANGLVPLFAFRAATGSKVASAGIGLDKKYDHAIAALEQTSHRSVGQLRRLAELYRQLYAARAAYDIYEYFGYFAFARNYIILKTRDRLAIRNPDVAKDLWYAATTHQYAKICSILDREPMFIEERTNAL